MIGLDWLRRKAAADVMRLQGSALPPDPEPTAERTQLAAAKDAIDLAAETMPTGFITYDGPLTEAEADEVRAAFERVVPQMEQMADTMLSTVRQQLPMRCPCVAIYSSCRCADNDRRLPS